MIQLRILGNVGTRARAADVCGFGLGVRYLCRVGCAPLGHQST